MAAPTNAALVKKVLANSEPSTHGPSRQLLRHGDLSGVRVERTSWRTLDNTIDPQRTSPTRIRRV
jgi:hypothetical protein